MICKKCGSENVSVQAVTSTTQHGRGFFMTLIHLLLIVCTCGVWLIVPLLMRKRIKSKTRYKNICQDCGYVWGN